MMPDMPGMPGMPGMMPEMGTSLFFLVALAALVCLLLIGTCIWLAAGWLKSQRALRMQAMPQPRDAYAYEEYEQGYRSQQPAETYQVGGQYYPYPQNEQPQARYEAME